MHCNINTRPVILNRYNTRNIINTHNFKENKLTNKKNDGKKTNKLYGIPKLDDANWAGGRKSQECALFLTEGDSAATFAIAGLSVIGRDKYENVLKIKKPNDINLLYEIFPTLQRSIKKMVFYKIIETKDTMCSICLEDFDETNQDVNLICGHRLHTNCIDKYIKNIENLNKLKCPICRTNFHIKSLL